MKVLVKGDKNPKWHREIKCCLCRAKLEVEESDIKWEGYYAPPKHPHDMDDDIIGEEFQIKCPECNQINVVADLPLRIERRLRPQFL